MREKYLISYKGKTKTFQTKQQIMKLFQCPLYIINKIIRKSNDPDYETKADCHGIYNEFYNSLDIKLIKPEIPNLLSDTI